jgi:hypothetical protein
MSSEGETIYRSSSRRRALSIVVRMLAIIIQSAVVGWASPEALAEEAMPAVAEVTAHSPWSSVERSKSDGTSQLVIGAIDGGDQVANVLARSTIAPEVSPVPSAKLSEKRESGSLLLSDFFEPDSDARALAKYPAERTIQYRNQIDGLRAKLKITDSESSSLEAETAPRPLLQIGVGRWQLPVVLLSAKVAQ